MKKLKNRNIFLILTIILSLGITLGAIYFMYQYRDSRENKISTGLISLKFTEQSNTVNLSSNVPMIDDLGLKNTPYEFTIENTSKVPFNVDIKVDVDNNTSVHLGAVRYGLYIDDKLVKKDYIHNDLILYTYKNMNPGEKINCKLYFWIDYYYDTPNKIFSGKIYVEGESKNIISLESEIKNVITKVNDVITNQEGVYYFDSNGDLDYGDNTKITLNIEDNIPKGNISIWNNQVIYGCFNYGNINYEYSYNQTKKKREIVERSMPCITDRYQNLVINGDLSYKSNLNLEQFGEYNQEGYLSLISNNSYLTLISTDYIPIDMNKTYQISIDMKTSNVDAKYYVGYSMYDPDKFNIDQWNVGYVNNSLTELTEDLSPSNSVAYFQDLSNWNANGSKVFIAWNKIDSTGYEYPELTYGNPYNTLFSTPEQLDKSNNIITLDSPWPTSRGKIPKGTKVSQANNSCGGYHYSVLSNSNITSNFETYSNSTINQANNTVCNKFRPGTKFIKFLIIYKYNGTGIQNLKTDIKNIVVKEVNE